MNPQKTSFIQRVALVAICLSLAATFVTRADDTENRGQLTAKDFKFVSDAAKGGMTEVSYGQLALAKAADPAVHDFAQRMVNDHQKANDELKALAAQKGATLPEMSAKLDEKTAEHYKNLSGADFDKAYMKDMVSDHKKTVKMFQKEGEKGDDADLKNWVTKTLPVLQEHLQMAESVNANVTGEKTTAKAQ
jgi:putative membrane protein